MGVGVGNRVRGRGREAGEGKEGKGGEQGAKRGRGWRE